MSEERTAPGENPMQAPAAGSDAVLRGMMLLALIVILVIGSYAIFFRRPFAPPAPVAADPFVLVPMLVQPTAPFPAGLSWPALLALADELPSPPGWQTRYQSARALAYLGSDHVPWNEYAELLDEHRQFCNFRTTLQDGRVVIEENAARQVILGALKDLAAWHAKHARISPGEKLLYVYDKVDLLAKSPIADLKSEAEKTQATLFR